MKSRILSVRALMALVPAAALLLASMPACAQQNRGTEARADIIVPYVPTPPQVVRAMLDVTNVTARDTVYDLGSGDGRIVIAAVADRNAARGLGVDIDPDRIREARENATGAGVTDRVEFRQQDLFETNLRPATVVTLYLLSSVNLKLRPKLFAELRPGTRVVSHAFDMGDWEPDSAFVVDGRQVFYWVMPAQVGGSWTWTAGGAARRIQVTQQHQHVTAATGSGSISAVRVTGDSIAFEMTERRGGRDEITRYEGRVEGDRITGQLTRGGESQPWTARRTGR